MTAAGGGIGAVLANKDLVVVCGPGGVGKTTSAAALGIAAARAGRRVVVVTVDPARRLADALGLTNLGDGPDADAPHLVEGAAPDGDGSLHAVMLDAASTFDRLIVEQSSSPEQAETILGNRVYQAISRTLSGAQEYMAIERLHELHTQGDWDLVVLDTPPSRHALDMLDAPDRLVGFLSHPVYRALTAGQRALAKVTDAAASAFLWAVRRLAGPQIVEDTLEFFRSIATMEAGLRHRATEVAALLHGPTASFVVVSSPRAEAIGEAEALVDGIAVANYPFGGVVVNLVHPTPPPLTKTAPSLDDLAAGPLRDQLAWHQELSTLAADERAQVADLATQSGDVPLVELPLLDEDVTDVANLAELAARLS